MFVGKVLHESIQKKLLEVRLPDGTSWLNPEWHEREVVLGSYKGRVDGLTHALPSGDAVVELKTADDTATKYELSDTYKWQGLAYALAAGVKQTIFCVIGKNQGLTKEVVVKLSAEWERKIKTHIRQMDRLWKIYQETKNLPRHYHRFPWEDRWCPYVGMNDTPKEAPIKFSGGDEATQEVVRWLDQETV